MDGVEKVAKLAGAVAGLVAYLYLLGGAVVWLHLATARLSGDAGLADVDTRHLLLVGCRVAIFELIILGAISLAVTLVVEFAKLRSGDPESGELSLQDGWSRLETLVGMLGPGLAMLGIAIGLSTAESTSSWEFRAGILVGVLAALMMIFEKEGRYDLLKPIRVWLERQQAEFPTRGLLKRLVQAAALALLVVNLVVGVAALPLFQGTVLVAATALIYAGPFLRWPGVVKSARGPEKLSYTKLFQATGLWAAVVAATAVALAWIYTPPVSLTRVELHRGDGTLEVGGLVSKDGDELTIAECELDKGDQSLSRRPILRLIHLEPDDELQYVGGQYWFDPGDRPSLLQAVRSGLHEDVPPHASAPLSHSLRRLTVACGRQPRH